MRYGKTDWSIAHSYLPMVFLNHENTYWNVLRRIAASLENIRTSSDFLILQVHQLLEPKHKQIRRIMRLQQFPEEVIILFVMS